MDGVRGHTTRLNHERISPNEESNQVRGRADVRQARIAVEDQQAKKTTKAAAKAAKPIERKMMATPSAEPREGKCATILRLITR
jgi:hypothetical protein